MPHTSTKWNVRPCYICGTVDKYNELICKRPDPDAPEGYRYEFLCFKTTCRRKYDEEGE